MSEQQCAYGHTRRVFGCASCTFDRRPAETVTVDAETLWGWLTEVERAAWQRSFPRIKATREAIERASGTTRPHRDLESSSQFRRDAIVRKEG